MESERYTTGHTEAKTRPFSAGDDASALEAAVAGRFLDRVRFLAQRRLHDVAEAEDVAQETIRRTIEALRSGRVHNAEALPAFVFQTARHICLHAWRTRERETRALDALERAPTRSIPTDPLSALIARERAEAVRAAVDRLTPSERELLRHLYFEGVDAAEEASTLGITRSALRVRKHRALKRLASLLDIGNVREASGT